MISEKTLQFLNQKVFSSDSSNYTIPNNFELISIPRFRFDEKKEITHIYYASSSRNHEYLITSSEQSRFTIYDLISNESIIYKCSRALNQPFTSCVFAYYSNYIICASGMGSLMVANFY